MCVKELTDEEALQNFLLDIDCLDELSMWTEKFNIFDVLKISRTEIRHSNMLAWLFDANENHGLGDKFVKKVMQKFIEKNLNGKFDVFETLLLDFYSFNIYREWNNIDLMLVSDDEKTVIAIENKVGSHEHSNQLNRYRKILEKAYPDYNKIYIFLTPDGLLPSDTDNWCVLTYSDIVDVLNDIKDVTELLPDVELMINNYVDVVRRDIVEDQQLIEICNKIYNKHKKALDLIYENRIDDKTKILNIIKNTLIEIDKSGKIIYDCPSSSLSFCTYAMNEILPKIEKEGSYNSGSVYSYWIGLQGDCFNLFFELGGKNVPDSTLSVMHKLIKAENPKDKKRTDFIYKRLRKNQYKIAVSDDLEGNVRQQVIRAVDDILKWEKELLQTVTENEQ